MKLKQLFQSAIFALALGTSGFAAAVPIVYEGTLTAGVTAGGFINDPSLTGSPNDDFWRFSANRGDVIEIIVNRLNAALDPATNLYFGVGADTTALTQVSSADDEFPELAGFAGPFADPRIVYTAAVSGDYTLQVWDFLSGPQVAGGFCYQVTLNGSPTQQQFGCNNTVPEPGSLGLMGLALAIFAGFGVVRRRRQNLP